MYLSIFTCENFDVSRNEIYIVYRSPPLVIFHFFPSSIPATSLRRPIHSFSVCPARIKERFEAEVELTVWGRSPFPAFAIMDSPRYASPLGRTRKLKLSLNDRSFIAGHRSTRRHARSANAAARDASRVRLSPSFSPNLRPRLRSEFGNADFHTRPRGRSDRQLPIAISSNLGVLLRNISVANNRRVRGGRGRAVAYSW